MAGAATGGATGRPLTVALWMPQSERELVSEHLLEAGFEVVSLPAVASLPEAFQPGGGTLLAVLDADTDPGAVVAAVDTAKRGRPGGLIVLYVVDPANLDALESAGLTQDDELLLRPWNADGLRWRVEAMAIRAQVPSDTAASGILAAGHVETSWAPSTPVFAVFNPKGGVGKTTIATNLAAVLQLRKHREVLLLDADTVTGHVTLSLGLPAGRSMADSWIDEAAGYPRESILDVATEHASGIHVATLTSDPLTHPNLDPDQVADAIQEARGRCDAIVVDMHPSYSEVNLAIFSIADRIVVPVTPDLPAMRAAIQLKEVAAEVGVRERLAMVINRANSGVSVSDMEETVGLAAVAQIRSAGMQFVWSANAGKTLIDKFPKHPATSDFDHLADRLLSIQGQTAAVEQPRDPASLLRSLFGRKAASEA